MKKQSDIDYISIGGMELMDTKAELINTLGEPTEIMNYSSGAVRYSYIASENSNIT